MATATKSTRVKKQERPQPVVSTVVQAAKLRTSYLADEKFSGSEPKWIGDEAGTALNEKIRQHMSYCNYHYSPKDLKKDCLIFLERNGFDKTQLRLVGQSYETKRTMMLTTAAALCRISNSGAPLEQKHIQYVLDKFLSLIAEYVASREELQESETKTTIAKPTIQDRLAEKLSEHISHFEGLYDQVIKGQKTAPDAVKFLQGNNVLPAQASKIAGWFSRQLNEIQAASEGSDLQLKEAYKHYKVKDFQRHRDFLQKLIEECDSYRTVKQRTRKPRVKKPADKTKLVSKLKYLKVDNTLGLASVRPEDILSASELWVYNTKTRKLGRYVATELDKTLSVKGTTILGFDEKLSVCKTLRKPVEQLKVFMQSSKPQTKKFLDGIKATETRLNGRINDDILLLKVL